MLFGSGISRNGVYTLVLTGNASSSYTIDYGANLSQTVSSPKTFIYTSWTSAQTINANSRSIIYITSNGNVTASDTEYYLTGSFNLG
jgi:hypothetical protein